MLHKKHVMYCVGVGSSCPQAVKESRPMKNKSVLPYGHMTSMKQYSQVMTYVAHYNTKFLHK